MKTTEYLNLKKPDQVDFYNVDDFNANMDIVDKLALKVASDVTTNSTSVSALQTSVSALQTSVSTLQTSVSALDTKVSGLLKVITVTGPFTTVGAQSGTAITFTYTTPSGYTLVGAIGFYMGSTELYPLRLTGTRIDVRNISSLAVTITPTITLLFVKTGLLG